MKAILLVALGGAVAQKHDLLSADVRVLLFTGLLGGFTTFSAFGLETMHLMKRGDLGVAAANVVLSVLAGLAALWLGMSAIPPRG
jgi:CrcB protein